MYTELVEGELHQVSYDEDEEDNQMKIVFMGTPISQCRHYMHTDRSRICGGSSGDQPDKPKRER